MAKAKAPAAEVKRLARLRVLAREQRAAERALERAIRAAAVRGIGTRRIAAATRIPHVTVWRMVRPANGQAEDAAEFEQELRRTNKPKTGRK